MLICINYHKRDKTKTILWKINDDISLLNLKQIFLVLETNSYCIRYLILIQNPQKKNKFHPLVLSLDLRSSSSIFPSTIQDTFSHTKTHR